MEETRLTVSPAADQAAAFDVWGNRVWWFQIAEPHERLIVAAESVVATTSPPPPHPPSPRAEWAALETPAYRDAFADALAPSGLVAWSDETRRFADSLAVPRSAGVAAWADALAVALNEALVYERGATDTSSTVDDVIRHGRGVCQDFAHVFVALCRMHGVAATYVSGWLYEPDRAGPVESHAWVSVQVPGVGWVEEDPTHPGAVGDRYVRIAVGRDYGDVVPIKGTYIGGATRTMDVRVELRELETTVSA